MVFEIWHDVVIVKEVVVVVVVVVVVCACVCTCHIDFNKTSDENACLSRF